MSQPLLDVELGRGRKVLTGLGEAVLETTDVIGILTDTETAARVADVECGQGIAAINLALAFPRISVVGFSSDPADVPVAADNAVAAGVAERVTFEPLGARRILSADRRFDVVFFFGSIQTMAHPRLALDRARAVLSDRGVVVIISPGAAQEPRFGGGEPAGRVMELDPGEQVPMYFPSARVLWCPPPSELEPGLDDQRGKTRSPEETRTWLIRRVEAGGDGMGSLGTHEGPDL